MNAVIYGAGNIGRGFLGEIFFKAGYRITFIDINEKIVTSLNEKGSYPVRHIYNDEFEEITIDNLTAVNCANEQEVIDCIAGADIMANAVGVCMLLGETYISDTSARADILLIAQNAMLEKNPARQHACGHVTLCHAKGK